MLLTKTRTLVRNGRVYAVGGNLPNLEQNFRTHAEEAIYNTEREDHRHAVDKSVYIPIINKWAMIYKNDSQTEEPRKGRN